MTLLLRMALERQDNPTVHSILSPHYTNYQV
jgi:hypothetical protein